MISHNESSTIKDWISVLAKMKLISLVEPYYSNISKRLIKSPKVYFLDSGLACRLQGWTQQEPILVSPHAGGLFETLVFAEIHKTMKNFRKSWQVYHWRSRDGEEIDFLIEMENQKKLFIEAKKTIQPFKSLAAFPELKKVFKEKAPPRIMVYMEGDIENDTHIPICKLRDFLLKY